MPYRFLLNDKTLTKFLSLQFIQLALLFIGWYVVFPEVLFSQIARGTIPFLLAFLLTHFFWCLWEFFLHRYILHMPTFSVLAIFAQKHNAHHALTYVRTSLSNDYTLVENAFPIVKEGQRPHSVFPWWALVGFFCIVTPLLFILQWLLPALPIFLGGYVAAFVTYVGYEVVHAFEHRSYDFWWKAKIEHPHYGKIWQRVYSFHLNHHAQPRSNESISGFLGLPLADWIFGTHKKTPHVLLDQSISSAEDFDAPEGYYMIRKLDRLALSLQKHSNKNEESL